ncbi:uncharacterized protein TM35_000142480 [Trypanosoma theileri]|uniref:Kinetoplast ribosomal PPR-repeat containing protein 3 n=1 Tax=Trypanosoma theileri TaxID=67003 RepID=A0A1X0NWF6_9TRYP|nr:uncharacterized protein TM35_000142480 [Trypanosoma theileri]ORC89037.1 hypothetical protein TM35_000142480 [Trypanosoma theileri]
MNRTGFCSRVCVLTPTMRNTIIISDALLIQRRRVSIQPVDTLRQGRNNNNISNNDNNNNSNVKRSYRFAVKDHERGLYDHGLTPDARLAIAEAESQYRASSQYLHTPAGGMAAPEVYIDTDGVKIECITAPVGEEYVPSHKERFAHRGHVGELSMQRSVERKYMLNAHAELNIRKERQLREFLSSPMPFLEKAEELQRLLPDFYTQQLTISSSNVEAIISLWAHGSLEQRMVGNTLSPQSSQPQSLSSSSSSSSSLDLDKNVRVSVMDEVPFLSAMKQLYFYTRQTHVAPTPLVLECMMTTLGAGLTPNASVFHLANRLLLDADKYVILPTRTTYAAFFTICSLHNAMSFAMARLKDAVTNLHISIDASMATALLKGLSQNGLIEEAISLLARLDHIPLDVQLLNASLEVLLLSEQPQACFSAFNATRYCAVKPNAETYTLLLLACERSGLWGQTTAILADMQTRRVKGDSKTLNLLLKGLLTERLHSYARQLYQTMVMKNVEVWPALESHMDAGNNKKKKQKKMDKPKEKVKQQEN